MKKKKILLWLAVAVYIGWIFSNSLTSGGSSGALSEKVARYLLQYVNQAGFTIQFDLFHFYVRKLAHFSEYFLLGILLVIAVRSAPLMHSKLLNVLTIASMTPLLDEGLQKFTPGRYGSFTDCAIDLAGGLAGALICYLIILIILDLTQKRTSQ